MTLSDVGWASEPALWVGLVEAIIVLLVAFGVPISADQKAAVIGLVSAVLAVVGAIVTRSQVTPTAQPASKPVQPA
jgi:uncharacterized membrane protein